MALGSSKLLNSRRIFKKGDELQIKKIEGDIKNCWKFEWIGLPYPVAVQGEEM